MSHIAHALPRPTFSPTPARDWDHLVYVRVTEACSLRCAHCFVPARPRHLEVADLATLPGRLSRTVPEGSRVLLQWHGGEPCARSVDTVRRMIDAVHGADSGYRWRHGIQTNLMHFSRRWADLFHEHFGSHIGASWDPGIRYLGAPGDNAAGRFESRFWRAVEEVHAAGLELSLTVTVTRALLNAYRNPFEFFERLIAAGIGRLHLERITPTGRALANWDDLGLSHHQYATAMVRYAQAYLALCRRDATARRLSVSPFDGLIAALNDGDAYGCWSDTCDNRFHTLDADGLRTGCTALTPDVRVPNGITLEALRDRRTRKCADCAFRGICKTNCPTLPVHDGSGECSGARALFDCLSKLI